MAYGNKSGRWDKRINTENPEFAKLGYLKLLENL